MRQTLSTFSASRPPHTGSINNLSMTQKCSYAKTLLHGEVHKLHVSPQCLRAGCSSRNFSKAILGFVRDVLLQAHATLPPTPKQKSQVSSIWLLEPVLRQVPNVYIASVSDPPRSWRYRFLVDTRFSRLKYMSHRNTIARSTMPKS